MAFYAATLVKETTVNRAGEALVLGLRLARKSKGLSQRRLAIADGLQTVSVAH